MESNVISSEPLNPLFACADTRLPSYQPMLLTLAFFSTGILLDRSLDLPVSIYLGMGVAAVVLWCGVRVRQKKTILQKQWCWNAIGSLLLAVSLASAGAFWFHARWNWYGVNDISRFASTQSQSVCIEARVNSEPRWMVADDDGANLNAIPVVDRTRMEITPIRIRDGATWRPVSGCVDLVIHERTDRIRSGDRVQIFGKLTEISGPSNPGQFDFREYYRSRSQTVVVHAIYDEGVVVIVPARRWTGARLLSSLRRKLNELTWRYVSPQRAGLASAILLGNRSQLSATRKSQFLMTGTVHLLAISGLHVGILSGVFFFFYRIGLIRRSTLLWSTIVFVLFYAWLVEFRPPVSRASILIVLFCIGRLRGYSSFSFNWLASAGFIILLINPSDLFLIGPQLSFLAVATITFGKDWLFWPPSRDPIKRLIANTRPPHLRAFYWIGRKTRAAILVSGLIWLVAMPLVAYRFNLVAPIALVVNPILLLPIALALYGGLGVLVLGWVSPWLGSLFGGICNWNLSLVESIVGLANLLPIGHTWTAGPSMASLTVFYVGLFFVAIFPATRFSAKWFLLSVLLWTVLGWWVPNAIGLVRQRQTEGSLVCTFADVGHGTAVLVELPNGRNLLYDAGSFGSANYCARNVSSLLWDHNIEHLDAVILSHADVDHFNALPQLCERFSIGVVYMSRQMMENQTPSVLRLLKVLNDQQIPIKELLEGKMLKTTYSKIKILAPPATGTGGSDNSDSIVVSIEYKNRRLLLTGDLESTGMELLLSKKAIDVDVLMAPHHGSIHSSPELLGDWARPEFIVISGSRNRIGDEIENVFADRGAVVFRTDRHGAVRFEIDGSGVAVVPFHAGGE